MISLELGAIPPTLQNSIRSLYTCFHSPCKQFCGEVLCAKHCVRHWKLITKETRITYSQGTAHGLLKRVANVATTIQFDVCYKCYRKTSEKV